MQDTQFIDDANIEDLSNNIPEVDNWEEIATDIIKLKMNPLYKNIEIDIEKLKSNN